jgi:hypothetical protein
MKKKLRLIILFDLKNLNLFGASRAKPFVDWHFFQWQCKTSHMPTSKTLITNQHNRGS